MRIVQVANMITPTSGGLGTVAQVMFSQLALNVPSQVWAVTLLLRTCIVILLPTILPISPWPHGPWRQQTLIFPEATCTNGKALITFRCGAFSPGVPVQPVAVRK